MSATGPSRYQKMFFAETSSQRSHPFSGTERHQSSASSRMHSRLGGSNPRLETWLGLEGLLNTPQIKSRQGGSQNKVTFRGCPPISPEPKKIAHSGMGPEPRASSSPSPPPGVAPPWEASPIPESLDYSESHQSRSRTLLCCPLDISSIRSL